MRVLREPIYFARDKGRCLKAFERFVVELCAIGTIKAVAIFLGVGWDMVKGIFKEDLRRRLKKQKLAGVRYIAVDEFALRKGHKIYDRSHGLGNRTDPLRGSWQRRYCIDPIPEATAQAKDQA